MTKNFTYDNTPASFTNNKLRVKLMTEKLNTEMEIVRKTVTEVFKRREVATKMLQTILSEEPVSNSCLNFTVFLNVKEKASVLCFW